MKNYKIYFLAILFFMFYLTAKSQLQITTGQTAAWYVQNVLLGGGVTVSNVTSNMTTSPANIGQFSNGNSTNLGINTGLILSSGDVSLAIGPNNSPSSTGTTGTGADQQLTNIATDQVYDATVLEFDFVPVSSIFAFEYVFASEEFPEYVFAGVNDVFGFFISGPNPSGGNYTNLNIAIIPGTNLPVSIDNVNNGYNNGGPCTNCQYYFDNTGGTTIQYDGFTTTLSAMCNVVPCQTYHIKLAIGDVGDDIYDSGVFLNGGSFSSSITPLTDTITTAALSCLIGTASVYTSGGAYPYSYHWSNGDSLFSITDSVGVYYVTITDNSCIQNTIIDSVTITSGSSATTAANSISATSTICIGQSTTLGINGGYLDTLANWNWYSGSCGGTYLMSGASIIQSPTITTIYYVRAEDACGATSCVSISISIYNNSTIPTSINATPSSINPGNTTIISHTGGTLGNFANWFWYEGTCGGYIIGSGTQITQAPTATTTYYVRAEGFCNYTTCISTTVIVYPLSISIISDETNDLIIYPNPFKSSFSIKIKENNAVLKIYNISGQLLREEKLKINENVINTKEFPKGKYLIEIISEENIYHYKIIKE